MTPKLSGLDHLVLTVLDIAVTATFYQDVLGLEARKFRPADGSKRTALFFGSQKINLHQAGAEYQPHAYVPTSGSADLCFLSDVSLDDWALHFETHSVEVEEGPVMRSGASGPIYSLYIRDPDGNLIEISNSA